MAKEKYVVASVKNWFGGTGDQGIILGEFRKVEFARHAREQMRTEASKRNINRVGIFLERKFLEEL